MAAIATAFDRTSRSQADVRSLKTLMIFCGVGLTLSLVLTSFGLDLSAGLP